MTRAYDPTDPDQFTERQRSAELRIQQTTADWRWMLGSPQGRRLLADLLVSTGWLQNSHTPGDPLGTAYQEGRRNIGIAIYTAVTAVGQSADLKALLAEVLSPPDVRSSNNTRNRNTS